MAGLIKKQMAAPVDDEATEDPAEEASESPAQEAAEPATGPASDPGEAGEDPTEEATETPGQEATEDAQEPGTGTNKITPQSLESQMHLTPAQKSQLQRIVLAGMKVMFDPKTHAMMVQQIRAGGPIEQRLGMSIAGLMGLLVRESNNSLPPNLIIPAGLILLAHAAEFLNEAKIAVSDHDISAAISVFVATVLKQFGLDPDKVAAIGGRAADPGAAPAPDSAAAAPAATAAPAGAAPAGGLIGSAMPQGGA